MTILYYICWKMMITMIQIIKTKVQNETIKLMYNFKKNVMKTKIKLMQLAVLWLVILVPAKIFAQAESLAEKKKEKIEAQKVAFITKKLDLTAEEAQKFWPVYNEYDAQKETMNKAYRQKIKGYKKAELTETQADSLIMLNITHDQNLLDLKKSYIAKFKAVLPSVKVAKIAEAEREFRKMLLKLVKEQRKEKTGIKK